jgi:hypothetical protein
MEDTIITKIKSKNRKARHTFPDEHDEYSDNTVKHKRRHSIHIGIENDFDSYNEKHIIIKKNVDGVKKEIIIRKYTKVHPVVEDTITEDNSEKTRENEIIDNNYIQMTKLLNILSKIAFKILCYTGILSCIAI